ncbi:hypothetical protein [Flavobacterium pectinovorum]|uniref:hypothetical protein n=1 Tax=Flavobacterium pectinovorum TaxID=29533 RepID=UPI001FADA420|nr:hypothetical protein [Flavobacterium pectinovorum]MCI9845480.1 hypothetical protein [Flavobacterium pectinovorum]
MYIVFKNIHSLAADFSLLFLLISIFYAYFSLYKGASFTKKSKAIALLGLIGVHLQLVLGVVLYFLSPMGVSNFSAEMMKNSTARLYALEHPMVMIIGIILITVGYSRSKKAFDNSSKFKNIAIFYTIGLILILSRIPWKAWLG